VLGATALSPSDAYVTRLEAGVDAQIEAIAR
jgi:hypothetical protein